MGLELEINEWLHLRRDELISHKDRSQDCQIDDGERQLGKANAISPLGASGQPMDDHSQQEQEEYPSVGNALLPDAPLPSRSDGIDHTGGDSPRGFIGHCRIQVGT